jgi:hypothetical protein
VRTPQRPANNVSVLLRRLLRAGEMISTARGNYSLAGTAAGGPDDPVPPCQIDQIDQSSAAVGAEIAPSGPDTPVPPCQIGQICQIDGGLRAGAPAEAVSTTTYFLLGGAAVEAGAPSSAADPEQQSALDLTDLTDLTGGYGGAAPTAAASPLTDLIDLIDLTGGYGGAAPVAAAASDSRIVRPN